MTKRVMVQTGIREGIRKVFDTRPDVEYELFTETSEENLLLRIVDYDAVLLGLAPLTAQMVAKATRLKVAARLGVGYDSVDVPALTRGRHSPGGRGHCKFSFGGGACPLYDAGAGQMQSRLRP